jgi:hypothetical protein|tara:strand:+ start:754 stop:870 length:117 start_codon:yes stop_codon:yes gene_type:complete
MALTKEETKVIQEGIQAYEKMVKHFEQLIENLKGRLNA